MYTFQIFYKLFREIYNKARRVKEDANKSFILYAGIPRFMDLRMQIQDFWYYITSNYLMLDRYLEYNEIFKIYAENILESVLSPDIEGDEYLGIMDSPSNIRPEKLEIFDLYCILQYLPLKGIQKITSKRKRKFIPIDNDIKNYLSRIVINFKALEFNSSQYQDLFLKVLHLVSNIKFDESLFSLIISELNKDTYLKDFILNGNAYFVNEFFLSILRQSSNISSNKDGAFFTSLSNFLEYMLSITEKIVSNGKGVEEYFQIILHNAINLHNRIEHSNFSSEKLNSIMDLKYLEILASIYSLVDEKMQEKIKNVAKNQISEISADNFYHAYLLLYNRVIDIDDSLEKDILEYITNLKDDRKTTHPSKYDTALRCITNLCIGDLLKNREIFSNIIRQSGDDFLEFVIDPNNFDFKKFKLNWLKHVQSNFLNELRQNEKILQLIRHKITQKYQEDYMDEDDMIMKIFFEYFADYNTGVSRQN